MSRRTDINELLVEVEEISANLLATYKQAKRDRTVLQIPRAKVKSALEHLRSVLDYCAADIYIRVYGSKPGKLYFPYGKNEALFNKHLASSFKKLREISPRLYTLLASVQPHVSGSNWLVDLCQYSNTNKHDGLMAQVKRSVDSVSIGRLVKVSGNSTVVFGNATVNGIPVGRDSSTPVTISDAMTDEEIARQLNPDNPFIPITRVAEEVKFLIEGSENDSLAFIQDACARISEFVHHLYEELDR
jgi:hypothetical protein